MYLNAEQLAHGSVQNNTLAPGQTANVVFTEYAPFQSKKGATIPKHKAKDAETGAELEFVGYKMHDCVKDLNDVIEPGITVVKVECLDNGSAYPDFVLSVVTGTKAKKPKSADTEEIRPEDVPF